LIADVIKSSDYSLKKNETLTATGYIRHSS
jgi:hypothetical protein